VDFEWDEEKSSRNLSERGFGFLFASRIFRGRVIEREDARFDYGERRIVAVGEVEGHFLSVVYTEVGPGRRRIISARPANRKERKRWQSEG
jgi:uncharacterized protein